MKKFEISNIVNGTPANTLKRGGLNWKEGLIPLTVPEVRRLIYRLVWMPLRQADMILAWSHWRRRHQARAKRCHYQRRLLNLAPEVRL